MKNLAHCAPYMTQAQTADLLELVKAQPQKKWRPIEKHLQQSLNKARETDARLSLKAAIERAAP
jgi:hypothetical protein